MALQMRGECERCQAELMPDGKAYICVYECTFCADCADTLQRRCPNCGGELVPRPRPKSQSPDTSGQCVA